MRPFTTAVLIADEELRSCDWLDCDVQLIVDSPVLTHIKVPHWAKSVIDRAE